MKNKDDCEFGNLEFAVEDLIEKKGLSKNKVAFRAEMQRTQLNNYINGSVRRLDTAVLCRLCHALDCDISDLVRYTSPKKSKSRRLK